MHVHLQASVSLISEPSQSSIVVERLSASKMTLFFLAWHCCQRAGTMLVQTIRFISPSSVSLTYTGQNWYLCVVRTELETSHCRVKRGEISSNKTVVCETQDHQSIAIPVLWQPDLIGRQTESSPRSIRTWTTTPRNYSIHAIAVKLTQTAPLPCNPDKCLVWRLPTYELQTDKPA